MFICFYMSNQSNDQSKGADQIWPPSLDMLNFSHFACVCVTDREDLWTHHARLEEAVWGEKTVKTPQCSVLISATGGRRRVLLCSLRQNLSSRSCHFKSEVERCRHDFEDKKVGMFPEWSRNMRRILKSLNSERKRRTMTRKKEITCAVTT